MTSGYTETYDSRAVASWVVTIPVTLNCEMNFAHEIKSLDMDRCLDYPEGQANAHVHLERLEEARKKILSRASHWTVATPTLFSAW